jgi:hypothetical protein
MSDTCMLAELGERIAEDGPAAHHLHLQRLSLLVADLAPGTAAALTDPGAPDVVRQRALAVASALLLRPTLVTQAAPGLAA